MGNISGQQPAILHITGRDRYEFRVVAAQVTFGRNRRGEVDRVVLHQNGHHQEVLKRGHSPQAVDLGEYTGDYRFPSSRAISVKREGRGLSIKLLAKGGTHMFRLVVIVLNTRRQRRNSVFFVIPMAVLIDSFCIRTVGIKKPKSNLD
jgi:hypothetical protein